MFFFEEIIFMSNGFSGNRQIAFVGPPEIVLLQPLQPPQRAEQQEGGRQSAGLQPLQPPRRLGTIEVIVHLIQYFSGQGPDRVPENFRESFLKYLESFFTIPAIYISAAVIGGKASSLGSDSEKEPDIFSSTLPLAILACGSVSLFLEFLFSIVALCDQDSFKLKLSKNMFEYAVVPTICNAAVQNGDGFNGLVIGLGVLSGGTVMKDCAIKFFRTREDVLSQSEIV